MPVTDEHRQRLEADLSGRERWLATLRRQIAGLENEASAHETILALGRDPRILQIVDEIHDQPELCRRIAEDPRSFLAERGVELPDDATVTVTGDGGIEAHFVTPIPYGISWSPAAGFHLIQPPDDVPRTGAPPTDA